MPTRANRGGPAKSGDSHIHGTEFKRWRKSLDLSQKEAAEALGLKRRVVQYYEKGERDGKSIDIPKTVRLACFALTRGQSDYHGPEEGAGHKAKRKGAGKRHKDKAKEKDKERGKGKKHAKPHKPQEALVFEGAPAEKAEKRKPKR